MRVWGVGVDPHHTRAHSADESSKKGEGEGGGKSNKEVARGDEEECTDGGVEQSTLSENERNRQRQTERASEREIREIFC
jgi:hypothetical protein